MSDLLTHSEATGGRDNERGRHKAPLSPRSGQTGEVAANRNSTLVDGKPGHLHTKGQRPVRRLMAPALVVAGLSPESSATGRRIEVVQPSASRM